MPRPTNVLKAAKTSTPLKGRSGYKMTAKRKAAIKRWQAAGAAVRKRQEAQDRKTAYQSYLNSPGRKRILKSYKFRR